MGIGQQDPLLKEFRRGGESGDVAGGGGVVGGGGGGVGGLLGGEGVVRENVNAPLFSFGGRAIGAAKGNMAMVDLLLEFGADIHLRSEWWAGSWGILDMVDAATAEALIARGA